jgi:hypothetical protein
MDGKQKGKKISWNLGFYRLVVLSGRKESLFLVGPTSENLPSKIGRKGEEDYKLNQIDEIVLIFYHDLLLHVL